MAKTKKKNLAQAVQTARVFDFSGGMNNAIRPSMLNDNESVLLQSYSLDEKGTLYPIKGRKKRYADGAIANPVNGIGAYHRSDGVSRLLIGARDKLYVDTPRQVEEFDSQADWETGSLERIDTTTTPGDIKPLLTPFTKTETSQADFSAGVLTNVVATAGGDLVLAKEGTNFSETDTLTADFNGTHSNTEAIDNAVKLLNNISYGNGITLNATPTGVGGGAEWGWLFTVGSSSIVVGKLRLYSLRTGNVTLRLWRVSDSAKLREVTVSAVASTWAEVSISEITLSASTNYIVSVGLPTDAVRITSANVTVNPKITFVEGRYSTTEGNFPGTSSTGYYCGIPDIVIKSAAYSTSGIYTHPAQDISGAVVANSATITFNRTIPANTALTVETRQSTNGGVDWSSWVGRVSGETIIPKGTSLANYRIQWRVLLSTTNTAVTPSLDDLTISVISAYKTSGNRVSPDIDLSSVGVVKTSNIAWNLTVPSGTSLGIETNLSTDGGVVWLGWKNAVSGSAIPDVTVGMDLGNGRIKFRQSLATTDVALTSTLHDITITLGGASRWISPSIDVSLAADKASGLVALVQTTPGASTVEIKSRSSANGTSWSFWVNASVGGGLNHTPDNYVQIALLLNSDGSNHPSVQKATVSFDGAPSVTLLASNFSPGGEFYFASLLDYISVVNGIDLPRKYDGTTLSTMAGDPPRANFVATHKNRQWMLKGSRLYFSNLLDIESWPVFNFIDISPNDGDTGTGLYPTSDYLVITKNRSIWLLIGDSIDTYAVRRLSASRGNLAPRSLIMANDTLCFVSDDGIYFSDFTQTVLASERLRATWDGLNTRRLNQAVSWFAKQKLYISLPNAGSMTCDTVIVFDTLRQAWFTIIGWNISCAADWIEAGKQVTLMGHANVGQVSELNNGQNNAGAAIEAIWESKHFDLGFPDIIKRFREVFVTVTPAVQEVPLEIQFIVDGGVPTAAITVTVPGRSDRRVEVINVDPAAAGIHYGRSLGFRVRQATLDAAVGIRSVGMNLYPIRELPTIRA